MAKGEKQRLLASIPGATQKDGGTFLREGMIALRGSTERRNAATQLQSVVESICWELRKWLEVVAEGS